MSRFGTGFGFNIQDIALISGTSTEVYSTYYRIHDSQASYDPDTTITNSTEFKFQSTTPAMSDNYLLIHVSKADIDGKKIYLDWDAVDKGSNANKSRALYVFDGQPEGDDPMFVNGATTNFGISIYELMGGDGGRFNQSTLVPDLTSYGDDISIVLECKDFWTNDSPPMAYTIYDLELRETNEDPITNYNLLGTVAETGTSGTSSFGTVVSA